MSISDDVILTREHNYDQGTFGQMYFHDVSIACTAELPWRGNLPDVSCIPDGRYWVEPYNSPAHPGVWHVTNVPGRSNILIHNGNCPEVDSEGCILVGDCFGIVAGHDAVMDSVATLEVLRGILPHDGFWLNIQEE